jgi:hypothetical protein
LIVAKQEITLLRRAQTLLHKLSAASTHKPDVLRVSRLELKTLPRLILLVRFDADFYHMEDELYERSQSLIAFLREEGVLRSVEAMSEMSTNCFRAMVESRAVDVYSAVPFWPSKEDIARGIPFFRKLTPYSPPKWRRLMQMAISRTRRRDHL